MNIETLAEKWIAAAEFDGKPPSDNHWAIDYVIELPYDKKFNELWLFIKHAYKKDISNEIIEMLAAGPMEDLLSYAGESYIQEIEDLARKDPKFASLLGGVWESSMSGEVWKRIQKFADKSGWDGN